MSITTEHTVTTMPATFEAGRELTECTGGIDKVALAAAKKQAQLEKKEAAAAAKAEKEAAKLEKQRAAEEKKAAAAAKKAAAAAVKAEKEAAKLEKQRLADEKKAAAAAAKAEKEIEKQRKAEAVAAKKAEKDAKKAEKDAKKAEKDAKKAEKDAKKAEKDAKKAEKDAKKAEKDAKKPETEGEKSETEGEKSETEGEITTELTSSASAQVDEVETLQVPVTDHTAEIVSQIAIPSEANLNEVGETSPVEQTSPEEQASPVEQASPEEQELTFENIDKELYGDETTEQKVLRLRKQANAFIREARELEKTLSHPVTNNDEDMREIEGIFYKVDDTFLYNRYDELVGFIESDEEITWTSGWNSEKGVWEYE